MNSGRRIIAAEPDARQTAAQPAAGNPEDCTGAVAGLPDWQQELAAAVRDPLELLALLDLTPHDLGAGITASSLLAAMRDFPLRVPRGFVGRMRRGDAADPLLRQVLPHPDELRSVPGYRSDPLEETAARAAPGLLQKYTGRALLVTTGACAVHCRYCFRRHFDYSMGEEEGAPRWSAALERLAGDPATGEIILSGGDPLSLGNARFGALLERLAQIPHLQRLRIHTRTPVVLPSRVDAGLLQLLATWRDRLVVVIHANHPAEIDAGTAAALRNLGAHCTALLNQSVLLAGVNADAAVLGQLSHRLFAAGVLPYYLHQLDRVAGAAHFAVDDTIALRLHASLAASLPGYLVPRLVREIPGEAGKTALRETAASQHP
jgi:EF-P beta-lysylation protein EpmB